MKIATGTMVGGKVVLDGAESAEGATVTVLSRECDEAFTASPELERALLQAIDDLENVDVVNGKSLLAQLRNRA